MKVSALFDWKAAKGAWKAARSARLLPLCFLLSAVSPASADDAGTLARGPYLLSPRADSIQVVWKTSKLCDSRLHYFDGRQWRQLAGRKKAGRHVMRVTGLQPDTRYPYWIEACGKGKPLAISSFITAPSPSTERAVHVDFMGDTRKSARLVSAAVVKRLRQDQPELLVHLGDISFNIGTPADYNRQFFGPFSSLLIETPVYSVMGNHDATCRTGYRDAFPSYFSGTPEKADYYYTFDYGPLHVIVLDTNTDYAQGSKQRAWLENELAALESRKDIWKIVALHVPPFTSGRGGIPAVGEQLVPLFDRYQVDLVFSGHTHAYQRSDIISAAGADIPRPIYIVTGGGGSSLFPQLENNKKIVKYVREHHFVRIVADRRLLTLNAISVDGKEMDSITLDNTYQPEMVEPSETSSQTTNTTEDAGSTNPGPSCDGPGSAGAFALSMR